jgi:hypothetical protein
MRETRFWVVSLLRLHYSTRQRYTLKTSRLRPFPALFTGATYLDTERCHQARCLSSKMCCLSEHVVCASVSSTLLWKSLGSRQFLGRQRSITENVLEQTKSLGRDRSTELVLMCGACGIIILDRHVSHHSLSCNITSMQLTEQSPSTTKAMTDLSTLDQAHFDELTKTVRGEVYRRGDHQYVIANVCS